MREEIERVIYGNKGAIDKLVEIARIVGGKDFDIKKLSKSLGINALLLETPSTAFELSDGQEEKKPEITARDYFIVFQDAFKECNGVFYKVAPMDAGIMKHVMKVVKLEEFKMCMEYFVKQYRSYKSWCKNRQVQCNVKWDIQKVCDNITVSKIYKILNLLLIDANNNKPMSGKNWRGSWGDK